MSTPEERLAALGLTLPEPRAPVANYVPFVRSGASLYISGQVSTDAAGGVRGVVGEDVSAEEAKRAAQICGLNLIAQMNKASETVSASVKESFQPINERVTAFVETVQAAR